MKRAAVTVPQRACWSGIAAPGSRSTARRPSPDLELPTWTETTRADICARIGERKGPLKILLKTKDDPYFLEPWIQHHAGIVGLEHLIIFDNMSTNAQVFDIYRRYQGSIQIVRFSGNHNRVHNTEHFGDLYRALGNAAEYYGFFDTDEFLVLIDHRRHFCGERILGFLRDNAPTDVLPATWLTNVPGSDTRFEIGRSALALGYGLAWGKPVVRSAAGLSGYINHNVLLDKSVFSGVVPPHLFLLHFRKLNPAQRIRANVNKLVAAGFAAADEPVEAILAKDVAAIPDEWNRLTARMLQQQLADAVEQRRAARRLPRKLAPGSIELADTGRVRYAGRPESRAFDMFLTCQDLRRAILETDAWALRTTPFDELKRTWGESTKAWDVQEIRRIAQAQLPRRAKAAVISRGDPELLDVAGVKLSHFPYDAAGGYSGWYPANDTGAVRLLDGLARKGVRFLIIPNTAFWWLEHYPRFARRLTRAAEVWRSRECVIYRLPRTLTVAPRKRRAH